MQSEGSKHNSKNNPDSAGILENILDKYLEELAAGGEPDQEKIIRDHPDLADALRGVFKTLDFVEATSRTLRADKLEKGTCLGEYRIIREIARGGMGVVYEAVQTSLGRRVALKVLPAGTLLSATSAERFSREAATAGKLHHSNIVPVYGVGETDGISYYTMQFIEGQSLSQHIKDMRKHESAVDKEYFKRVARWGLQVADALEYAHRQGIIHRDVKPSNLLLDALDNVWVTDFGLARTNAMASITVTGDVVGTARYMAPEQARGGREQVDARADIYSLGASLYEMLSLAPAVEGESREEVLNNICFVNPKPLRQLNRHLPKDLETIVSKCMWKIPSDRYATAGAVAEDLRRFIAGESILARRTPVVVKATRYIRKHRFHVIGATLAISLAIIAIGLRGKLRRMEGTRLLDQAYTAVLYEGDNSKAIQTLDKAEKLGVDSARLHLYRALVPLLDNQPGKARENIDIAQAKDPQNADITYALALTYAAEGDFFNSKRVLSGLENTDPPTALAWYLRGLTESKTTGKTAIDSYNRAIELCPDFTPAIAARARYRGTRLLTEGDTTQLDPMLNDLDALVVFRPKLSASYLARARGWLFAAAHAKNHESYKNHTADWLLKCRTDLAQAMNLRQSGDSLTFVQQGVYLRYTGDYAAAAESFAEAIRVDKTEKRDLHPYRAHEYATMLYAQGRFEEALAVVEPACEKSPRYCPLVLLHSILLAETGQLDEAKRICAKSIIQQRGNSNGLYLSAVVMELLGDSRTSAKAISELDIAGIESGKNQAGSISSAKAAAFLTRQIDEETFITSAGNDPGALCEAAFLAALRRLGEEDKAKGLQLLADCIDTNVLIFTEYRFAQAFRARVKNDSNWPAWINPN